MLRTILRIKGQGLVVFQPRSKQSRRPIDISPGVIERLKETRRKQIAQRLLVGPAWQGGNWVFTRPDGRPVNPDDVTHEWLATVNRLKLPVIRFHDLRHTPITLLLAAGENIKVVSERAGHSTSAFMLEKYAHVLPTQGARAARRFEELVQAGG